MKFEQKTEIGRKCKEIRDQFDRQLNLRYLNLHLTGGFQDFNLYFTDNIYIYTRAGIVFSWYRNREIVTQIASELCNLVDKEQDVFIQIEWCMLDWIWGTEDGKDEVPYTIWLLEFFSTWSKCVLSLP